MSYSVKPLRNSCNREFVEAIRDIITRKDLTWGQKCLCISLLDVVGTKTPSNKILAARLGVEPAQISEWLKAIHKRSFEWAIGIFQPQVKA